jgi:hypothetical protein
MGCITLIASALVYLELIRMGFPDGFLTEFERAERILYRLFLVVSIPTGLWFLVLGWIETPKTAKLLTATGASYLVVVVSLLLLGVYLSGRLMGGAGG